MSSMLRRRLTVTVLAVAGLLGLGLVGTAQAANVSGTVKTFDGNGVGGVTVSIKVGAAAAVTATTAADGTFTATGVTVGAATIGLTGPTTPNAALPPVWSIGGMSKAIAGGDTLTFTLPTTYLASFELRQSGTGTPMPIAGAKVHQCTPPNPANAATVLPGGGSVAPTQDLTGTVTDASGDASVRVFADSNLAIVCASLTTSGAGQPTTDIIARTGKTMDVSTSDAFKPITVPAVVDQTGTIKDSGGNLKANLTMAVRSGSVDSVSQPTGAGGAYSVKVDPGAVDNTWRINGRSTTGPLPSLVPRIFKTVFTTSGVLGTTPAPVNVNLPATVTLTVRVVNAGNNSPVKGAILRPVNSTYGTANSAVIVTGLGAATITQQVYSDGFSDNNGNVTARLFPDGSLQSFLVVKSRKGPDRQVTVAQGTVLTGNKSIQVVLPK